MIPDEFNEEAIRQVEIIGMFPAFKIFTLYIFSETITDINTLIEQP